jgi:hypothetical protein
MKRAETPYKRGKEAAEREFKKKIRPMGAINFERKLGGNVRRFFVGYNAFYERMAGARKKSKSEG